MHFLLLSFDAPSRRDDDDDIMPSKFIGTRISYVIEGVIKETFSRIFLFILWVQLSGS